MYDLSCCLDVKLITHNITNKAPFLDLHPYLFLTVLFPPKFMINAMTLILDIVNFPFLDGDVPRRLSYISLLYFVYFSTYKIC